MNDLTYFLKKETGKPGTCFDLFSLKKLLKSLTEKWICF